MNGRHVTLAKQGPSIGELSGDTEGCTIVGPLVWPSSVGSALVRDICHEAHLSAPGAIFAEQAVD